MPEVPTTNTLEQLYHRIAELEADLRVISGNIEYVESLKQEAEFYRRASAALALSTGALNQSVAALQQVRLALFGEIAELSTPAENDQ